MFLEDLLRMVRFDLCSGCATCVSLCPRKAIRIVKNESNGTYAPVLDKSTCNNCGLCYRVCPSTGIGLGLSEQICEEEREETSENIILGKHLNCYVAHSTDANLRTDSSSGGSVTQLLIFALQKGIIDGALVTRMNEDRPLEPEPFIARTKQEILQASKSKYCPVPANVALKEILNEKGKYAVVGLPCHIRGVRKAEIFNQKLRERIVLRLGLFCGHTPNFLGTEFLLRRFGVEKTDVRRLSYRGNGWPGGLSIVLKNGSERFISFRDFGAFLYGSYLFTPLCCMCCTDATSELADLSFGDAWLPEFKHIRKGLSIIVSRTKMGDSILKEATSDNYMKTFSINCDKVIQSQSGLLYKKRKVATFRSILRSLGYPLGKNTQGLLDPKVLDFCVVSVLLSRHLSYNPSLRAFKIRAPNIVLKLYTRLIYALSSYL
jgi:coenzyme F420 hydrogenase subunit beta